MRQVRELCALRSHGYRMFSLRGKAAHCTKQMPDQERQMSPEAVRRAVSFRDCIKHTFTVLQHTGDSSLPEDQAHMLCSLPIFETHNSPAQIRPLLNNTSADGTALTQHNMSASHPVSAAARSTQNSQLTAEHAMSAAASNPNSQQLTAEPTTADPSLSQQTPNDVDAFVALEGWEEAGVCACLAPSLVDLRLLQHCCHTASAASGGSSVSDSHSSQSGSGANQNRREDRVPTVSAALWLKCASAAEEAVMAQQLGVTRLGLPAFVAGYVVEQAGRGLLPCTELDGLVMQLLLQCVRIEGGLRGRRRVGGSVGGSEEEELVKGMR